jgi:DNA polymerase III delta prime subunit
MIGGRENFISDFKRLADAGKLAHGYILFGYSRTGMRSFAFSFARYLETGKFSQEGGILGDTLHILPDANKTLGIERIREIKNFLWQRPNRSPYRTIVIDGPPAGWLTDEAQNALLKITEEPPPSALLFLLIDDPERLRPTLASRLPKIFFPQFPGELNASGEYAEIAKRFLKSDAGTRGALLKELVGDEHFDWDRFLEALLLITPVKKENFNFWHAVLKLRREINYFNLNPRLQLMALAERGYKA